MSLGINAQSYLYKGKHTNYSDIIYTIKGHLPIALLALLIL